MLRSLYGCCVEVVGRLMLVCTSSWHEISIGHTGSVLDSKSYIQ